MCDKAVDTCPFLFDSVPDQYITQELCDKGVSENSFTLKYCHDKYKTQKMWDKTVNSHMLPSKFVSDCFVTSSVFEKLDSALFSDDYIVFGDLDPDFVTFFIIDIGLNSISLDNINLDDDNFHCCDPETIIVLGLWVCIINLNNAMH